MKKYLYSFLTLFAMCLAFSFTSCSDDDDDKGEATSSKIIGKWVCVGDEGYMLKGDKKTPFKNTYKASDESDVYEFKADGTLRNYGYYINDAGDKVLDYDDTAKWILDGSTLIGTDEEGEKDTCKVKELTDSKLVLIFEDEDMGEIYYSEDTYQKVK